MSTTASNAASTDHEPPYASALGREACDLLRRLIVCDTSNPPGNEAQAVAILDDYLGRAGVDCQRIAKDPARPNLLARLPGRGSGPSLAFLGHADVVQARRQDWHVEPFAGIEQDGSIWGRGAVDMKCQVAATAVALATLAREGFQPNGDLMLTIMADEEVGESGVGAPFFVEALPDLRPDFLIGEGAGERIPASTGPLYLLDHGVKASTSATLVVRGRAGDASLPDSGENALFELTRLLGRLNEYRSPVRVVPEVEPLLAAAGATAASPEERVRQARQAHPALDRLLPGLTGNVIVPTVGEASGPANVVPEEATVTMQCVVLPGTTKEDVERELRTALGQGCYTLEVSEVQGGLLSPLDTVLHQAVEGFLAEHDPEARLVPCLGYGYSDCHTFREAYGTCAYGFMPFRHADPMVNLTTKHGIDERILADDLAFQAEAALHVARAIGSITADAREAP